MGLETVDIPIPGKIVSVAVSTGQQVNEGDVLCVLESMKMENPILSPVKGVVKEVKVTAGQFVSSGAVAATIEC
ncbi:MAG: biotin/lipoyl-containing protein [Chloroflexota bacterium]